MPPLTRRAALTLAAAAVAGPALARPGLALGVQLWAVKDELDRDFQGTLRRIAAIGYRTVETAGLHGRSPDEVRRALDAAGLRCDSMHAGLADLEHDPAGQIAAARTLGARVLVCSAPRPSRPVEGSDWAAGMRRAMSLADYRRTAEAMDRAAPQAIAAGLEFAYHNHAFDFAEYDGVRGFDELMRRTDPRRVKLELDVGWVVAGGADPVALLRALGPRVRLLHLKDLKARPRPGDPASPDTVPIGQGVIDWPAVLRAAGRAGVREAFVEQEPPFRPPPLTALDISYRYLQSLHL